MNAKPLAGLRVVVTRAQTQAEGLLTRLRELGAEPIAVALIEIVEPSDGGVALRAALAHLDQRTWVVVTSPNAAQRLAPALAACPAGQPLVATIGTATAAVFDRPVDLLPSEQRALGLIEAFPQGNGSVLVVQPEGSADDLAAGLREKGWSVHSVAAYRTVARVPTADERARLAGADAVLFASGSAARSWADAFGAVVPPLSVAIGPSTAQEMSKVGLIPTVVATDYSEHGIIHALIAHISTRTVVFHPGGTKS